MRKNVTKALIMTLLITGCASFEHETVVATMENKSRPDWATLSKVMFEDDGRVFVVGLSVGEHSDRLSTLTKLAQHDARRKISQYIQNEVGFIFQNVEEGSTKGSDLSHYFGTELSKSVLRGVRSESHYYEKILLRLPGDDDGELELRFYSLLSIKKRTLQKLLRDAMKKDRRISERLKQKVMAHLDSKMEEL